MGSTLKKVTMLGISEASSLLGVSEATLRQWTDEGKIRAFVTPGGHRRYSESELHRLVSGQRQVHGLKDLVKQIKEVSPMQPEPARQYMQSTSWYSRLDNEARRKMSERGRHLVELIIEHISDPQHPDALEQARHIGEEYGADLARLGFPLSDALEAFLLHRAPVLNAVTEFMKNKELHSRTIKVIPEINHLLDETLLALVEAHQRYTTDKVSS
jgi:excisionase family DNA binding protein